MLNPQLYLHTDTLQGGDMPRKPSRDGFGKGLVELGKRDDRVVALCADLAESTRMLEFKTIFPDRYVELGVAEQNLAAVASGMAAAGKIPFIASYASFSPGRNNEQIRTTIALNHMPVKIIGSHAGLSVGPDGATHQALEDVGLMRMLPHMTVVQPCDAEQARLATEALLDVDGPAYVRLSRAAFPVFTTAETPFEIGKAQEMYVTENPQAGIIATGALVHTALLAAHSLRAEGIEVSVMNIHTIKPLDIPAVVALAKRAGALITCEEHQVAGGLGSLIAETVAAHHPVPMEYIGVHDQFGQSGEPDELMKHYGLDVSDIVRAVKKVIERK
ncbi:MAG: transketolase family protein [Candidatus Pacebacteria bacterium]|nr:transketolase family protein [Candidatus Paceibacterota bacterium]MCD8508104.1 transketolase family protein [Candidatus Paceibacterota bacterium]MCD8528096.1 transketolase family protein [Candidatus Paceibacterota bacterium]MCD8563739.1 transketolase family protein [Candidatus Paceibacterota bacterium]